MNNENLLFKIILILILFLNYFHTIPYKLPIFNNFYLFDKSKFFLFLIIMHCQQIKFLIFLDNLLISLNYFLINECIHLNHHIYKNVFPFLKFNHFYFLYS